VVCKNISVFSEPSSLRLNLELFHVCMPQKSANDVPARSGVPLSALAALFRAQHRLLV
jgi:hypothetical protein